MTNVRKSQKQMKIIIPIVEMDCEDKSVSMNSAVNVVVYPHSEYEKKENIPPDDSFVYRGVPPYAALALTLTSKCGKRLRRNE